MRAKAAGWLWAAWLVGALAGCQSGGVTGPVDRGDVARLAEEERRLLGPFLVDRAIVADRIEIEISPNFYARIAQPALSPGMHRSETLREDAADVYRFRNEHGGVEMPLDFGIANTSLTAIRSAVLRVRSDRSQVQLRVVASGNVGEGFGGKVSRCQEIVYADGAIQRR